MLINGTKLEYKTKGGSSYTQVKQLMDIPEIGSTKEKVDTTPISATMKTYEFGVGDAGEIAFTIGTESEEDMVQYMTFLGLDKSNAIVEWKLTYPNGFNMTFSAMVNVVLGGGSLNGHVTYTLNLALTSEIEQALALDAVSTSVLNESVLGEAVLGSNS